MVPKLLNDDQKEWGMQVCQDILERQETQPDLLDRVIIGDESWIFQYDLETKRQIIHWRSSESPRPKTARQSKSNVNLMLITFIDIRSVVHFELVIATGPDDHQACLQKAPAAFDSFSTREEAGIVRTTHGCFTMTNHQLRSH